MVTATVTATERRPRRRVPGVALALACMALPAAAIAGDWEITPTLALSETATDNVALTQNRKQGDLVSDLNPGILIDGQGGRVKLHFDYQLHNLYYAQDSSRNQTQNWLNALGTVEAIENWFYIEGSGVISQQSISAFGGSTASTVNTNTNGNTTETSTYRLSPYFRGTAWSNTDYQLRYNHIVNTTKSGAASNWDSNELVASLNGATRFANLSWSVDATSQKVNFETGRDNSADRLRAVLNYQIDPQFRVSLIGGREANDYVSIDKQGHTTSGAGFEWSPTERTKLAASREKRFFGDANSISFSHRTAGTVWSYVETKDANVQPTQATNGFASIFDLLFARLPPSLSVAERTVIVNGQLGGIPPTALVQGGFQTSGVTLQHTRNASFALVGVRNTITFSAFKSESKALLQGTGTGFNVGDFSNVQNVDQEGGSVNWSHKLTPLSSLVASYSRIDSKGTGTSSLKTDETFINVSVLTQLGPKTYGSVGARHVIVDGTASYTENAVTATLSHRF